MKETNRRGRFSGARVNRLAIVLSAHVAPMLCFTAPARPGPNPSRIRIGRGPPAMQLQGRARHAGRAEDGDRRHQRRRAACLGRKLEMVVADETENPETGISAIKKLNRRREGRRA